jgi:hypothetical protein
LNKLFNFSWFHKTYSKIRFFFFDQNESLLFYQPQKGYIWRHSEMKRVKIRLPLIPTPWENLSATELPVHFLNPGILPTKKPNEDQLQTFLFNQVILWTAIQRGKKEPVNKGGCSKGFDWCWIGKSLQRSFQPFDSPGLFSYLKKTSTEHHSWDVFAFHSWASNKKSNLSLNLSITSSGKFKKLFTRKRGVSL